ncbi:RNA editing associated helicase 2 [Perkinsela sp. CCAP 1560/4]|nr:RNA editing associated helicase 2 [Perkinsela sp. CCAP 1560/4]|eukprot:KNH09471.1 RNA editing associated helicase 2 [Perkinsela sp. CCAP 1560/4]
MKSRIAGVAYDLSGHALRPTNLLYYQKVWASVLFKSVNLNVCLESEVAFQNKYFFDHTNKDSTYTSSFRMESLLNQFSKSNVSSFSKRLSSQSVGKSADETISESSIQKASIIVGSYENTSNLSDSNLLPSENIMEGYHAITGFRFMSEKEHYIYGVGIGETSKDAVILSYMHIENILDSMGFELFILPTRQQKHSESQRLKGLWAPLPGEKKTDQVTHALPLISYNALLQKAAIQRGRISQANVPNQPRQRMESTTPSISNASYKHLDTASYTLPPFLQSILKKGNFNFIYRARDNEIFGTEYCTSSTVLDPLSRGRIVKYFKVNSINYDQAMKTMPFKHGNKTIHVSYIDIPGIARVENRQLGIGVAPRGKEAELAMCQHVEHLLDLHGLPIFKDNDKQAQHKKYAALFGRTVSFFTKKMILTTIPPFYFQCSEKNPNGFILDRLCPHLNTNVHTDVTSIDLSARRTVQHHFRRLSQQIQEYSFSYTMANSEPKVGDDRQFQTCYRHILILPKSEYRPECCACGSARSRVDAVELAYVHAAHILSSQGVITDISKLPPPYRRVSTRQENDLLIKPMKTSSRESTRIDPNCRKDYQPKTPSGNYVFSSETVAKAQVSRYTRDGFVSVRFISLDHRQPEHTMYSPGFLCTKSKGRVLQWEQNQQTPIKTDQFLCALKVTYPDRTHKLWSVNECQLSVDISIDGETKKLTSIGQGMTKSDACYAAYMHLELLIDWCGMPLYGDGAVQEEHAQCCKSLGRWAVSPSSPEKLKLKKPDPLRQTPASLDSGVIVHRVSIDSILNAKHYPNVMITHKDLQVGEMLALFKDPTTTARSRSLGGQENECLALMREFIASLSQYFDRFHPTFQKSSLYKTNASIVRRPAVISSTWVPLPNGKVQLVHCLSSSNTVSLGLLLNAGLQLRLAGHSFFSDRKKDQICDEMILMMIPNDQTVKTDGTSIRYFSVTSESQSKMIISSMKGGSSRRKKVRLPPSREDSESVLLPWDLEQLGWYNPIGPSGTFNRSGIMRLKARTLLQLPRQSSKITLEGAPKLQLVGNLSAEKDALAAINEWTAFATQATEQINSIKRDLDLERLRIFRPPLTQNALIDHALQVSDAKNIDIFARTNLYNFCFRKGLPFPRFHAQLINNRHLLYLDIPGYPHLRAFGCAPNIADATRRAAMHAIEILSLIDAEFQPSSQSLIESSQFNSSLMRNVLELFIICQGFAAIATKITTENDGIRCTMTMNYSTSDCESETIQAENLHGNIRQAKEGCATALFTLLLGKLPTFHALVEIAKSYPQLNADYVPLLSIDPLLMTITKDLLTEYAQQEEMNEEDRLDDDDDEQGQIPWFGRSRTNLGRGQKGEFQPFRAETACSTLPIYAEKDNILQALKESQVLFLCGTTGCGKTTQVPQYLYHENSHAHIIITQPRRISAISIASRVASEMNESAGRTVGYCVRFDSRVGTNINYVTTGILLQRLKKDPLLQSVTHLLIDEVHERDANTDLLLALVKRILPFRPTLRVIIMTATLNLEEFTKYFANAPNETVKSDIPNSTKKSVSAQSIPIVRVESGIFPVQVFHLEQIAEIAKAKNISSRQLQLLGNSTITLSDNSLDYKLMSFVIHHAVENDGARGGSILVFLPGLQDIHRAIQNFDASPIYKTFILHSKVPSDGQMECFKPVDANHVKIVFATNIAESSITIPDVRVVIDFGFIRERVYKYQRGRTLQAHNQLTPLPELITVPASQVNCIQRKGRAGRTEKGICYRLFTSEDFTRMEPYRRSELLQMPLDAMVLDVSSLERTLYPGDIREMFHSFMTPPPRTNIEVAVSKLQHIGALDSDQNITLLGRVLNVIPLPPNMARTVLWACIVGCLDSILTLVAISELDGIFNQSKREDAAVQLDIFANSTMSEHIGALNAYNEYVRQSSRDQCGIKSFIENACLDLKKLVLVSKYKKQIHSVLRDVGFLDAQNFGIESHRCFSDQSDASRNAKSISLVKSLLCSMYTPNFGLHCGQSWRNNPKEYRTKFHPLVKMTSDSPIDRKSSASPFVVYNRLFGGRSRDFYIECATHIPVWGILLFGVEKSSLCYREDLRLCVIDDWLMIGMGEETFDCLIGVKTLLNSALSCNWTSLSEGKMAYFRQALGNIVEQIVSTPVKHGSDGEFWLEEGTIKHS